MPALGTIDQRDAAGNPPGLDYGWFATRPVPESERAALIALFDATGSAQVSDYGSAGPEDLRTIRQAIQDVADSVRWTATQTQPECP